jgi:hypothetical protein
MSRTPTLYLLGATAIAAFFTALLFLICTLIPNAAQAGAVDHRYCYLITDIPRDSRGVILRSSKPVYAFRLAHPCPITLKTTGACPGWSIDHVIPLASGGCDIVENMQWLPVEIKSCAGKFCKDRWERIINAPGFGE